DGDAFSDRSMALWRVADIAGAVRQGGAAERALGTARAGVYPRREDEAVAEWYASRQAQLRLLGADGVAEIVYYDREEAAADVVASVGEAQALVVLESLIVIEEDIVAKLRTETQTSGGNAL